MHSRPHASLSTTTAPCPVLSSLPPLRLVVLFRHYNNETISNSCAFHRAYSYSRDALQHPLSHDGHDNTSLSTTTTAASRNSTTNVKWQDLIKGQVEYEHPWLGFKTLDDVFMDKTSRFLIQNLQDLYHGILTTYDRPTTEQCNKIIHDLMNCALDSENTIAIEAYAFRADAILQCMQLFANIDPNDAQTRLPYPLPHPDRTTYVKILTLFAKTKQLAAKKGPLRCLEIVEDMKQAAMTMGDLTLQPIAHDYNKVLLAWGTSVSPEKALHAANLLQQMKRDEVWDSMSYNHVLRACAFSKFDENKQGERLGGSVALKVYHDMVQNKVECNNMTYSYFLRACAFVSNDKQREGAVEEAFSKCCSEGNVDETIVLRLRQVASPQLWKKVMGSLAERESIGIEDLPTEWTRRKPSSNEEPV